MAALADAASVFNCMHFSQMAMLHDGKIGKGHLQSQTSGIAKAEAWFESSFAWQGPGEDRIQGNLSRAEQQGCLHVWRAA